MIAPVPTTDPLFPAQWLALAVKICDRYFLEYPEQDRRYGDRGRSYSVHDNAYLVAWLVEGLDLAGSNSFTVNVVWLRNLLAARRFPMDAFSRNLGLVAEAVAELRPADSQRIHQLVRAALDVASP